MRGIPDHTVSPATKQLRCDIVTTLDVAAGDPTAYHDRTYFEAALDAGFDVTALAVTHDVSKKIIYRALDEHDIDHEQPPSPARHANSGTRTRMRSPVMTNRGY